MKTSAAMGTPILRLRPMAVGISAVALLIAAPLMLVWKQAYIAQTSVRLERLADTLVAQNREIAHLRLDHENLSATERIESIARTTLDLDYPSPEQIVIVTEEKGLFGRKYGGRR